MARSSKSAETLIAALSTGNLREAEALFIAGIDINSKVDGRPPLHYLIEGRGLRVFRWLLTRGASLNELDADDLTPLMIACSQGGKRGSQIAIELIGAGCDVLHRRKGDGMSAIEFAAKSASPAVLRALVEGGASLDGLEGAELFPALLATRGGNLENLKTLIELGCDLSKTTRLPWANGMTCLEVARLERKTAIVKFLEAMRGKRKGK